MAKRPKQKLTKMEKIERDIRLAYLKQERALKATEKGKRDLIEIVETEAVERCPDCGLVEPLLYPCFASDCPFARRLGAQAVSQEFPPRHTIKNELDAAEIRKLEAELAVCVEDNDELRAEIERQRQYIAELEDLHCFKELRAENERLKAAVLTASLGASAREAEIEQLKAENVRQLSDLETVSGLAETLEVQVERLQASIRDAIEALERNSTSAPVLEALRAALEPKP